MPQKVLSPLAVDQETVKKYKLDEGVEISPVRKLAFLQEQLEQIQTMHWRARVDVIHARRLQASTNEVIAAKGNNNLAQHLNEVEQSAGAILMLKKFIDELRAEYPELQPED